jgi:choline dehydrogenase
MHTIGSFDYVIAGGGTAGCVLANRLSADPSVSVLVLEAGGPDKGLWLHIPVGYLFCIGNPRTDWCYRTEPDPGLHGRTIGYARGRVLGGCSSINAMLYMRGQARDYDEWARLTGDPSWAWDRVLPIFKGTEDYWGGADQAHGVGGEWRVEQQRLSWEILDAFRDAAAEVGIPKIDDFNRGDNEGSSRFEVNQRRGVRWNATKAFLRPVRGRKNLTVITGAPIRACGSGAARTARPRPEASSFTRATTSCSPRRAARPCSPRARSARRTSCSSPASVRARCSRRTGFPWSTTCPAWVAICKITCNCGRRSRCRTR